MTPAIRRHAICGLVFIAGLLAGAGLTKLYNMGLVTPHTEQQIAPGSEILGIINDEVMSLTYRTDVLTLTAQRSRPAEPFALQITFVDARQAQHCLASPDLAGQLARFATIVAKRQVQAKRFEAEFPQKLGTLELRDRIFADPPPAMAFRTTADKAAIALSYDGFAAEVGIPIDAFAKLEAGCAALAQP